MAELDFDHNVKVNASPWFELQTAEDALVEPLQEHDDPLDRRRQAMFPRRTQVFVDRRIDNLILLRPPPALYTELDDRSSAHLFPIPHVTDHEMKVVSLIKDFDAIFLRHAGALV